MTTLLLHSASFALSQDGDCNDSEHQELRVSFETGGNEPFLVIKTGRWAVDHPDEIQALLTRLNQAVIPLFRFYNGADA